MSVNRIASLRDFAKCNKLQVFLHSFRNSIFARIASMIWEKSSILLNFQHLRYYGCMIIPVQWSITTGKLLFIIFPIWLNSTITSSRRKKGRNHKKYSSIWWLEITSTTKVGTFRLQISKSIIKARLSKKKRVGHILKCLLASVKCLLASEKCENKKVQLRIIHGVEAAIRIFVTIAISRCQLSRGWTATKTSW